jgi:hypothetical protein
MGVTHKSWPDKPFKEQMTSDTLIAIVRDTQKKVDIPHIHKNIKKRKLS